MERENFSLELRVFFVDKPQLGELPLNLPKTYEPLHR